MRNTSLLPSDDFHFDNAVILNICRYLVYYKLVNELDISRNWNPVFVTAL